MSRDTMLLSLMRMLSFLVVTNASPLTPFPLVISLPFPLLLYYFNQC